MDEKARMRKRLIQSIKSNWQLYVMLLLPVLYLILFCYKPMVGLQLAFRKYTPRAGIWGGQFMGLYYFKKFFNSYKFWQILRNTLIISGYQVLASVPIPIILALAINCVRNQFWKKTVQLLSYMPHFISTVVMVSILFQLLNPRIGVLAVIAGFFGKTIGDVFGSPTAFPHLYVWSGIWQNMGWASIIYLAALSGVAPELHEAAIVDGATRFQRVRYIDFPTLIPTISILVIMDMGRVMSLGFEKIYLMQNSLNISASEVISTYTYKIGLTGNVDYSYSTAIGLFNSVINLILVLISNKVSNKLSGSGLF